MLIREAHLAAYRINWDDKATNIRDIARELNIGLDHMLLIDDSPHERAWVRQEIPELRVPELPSDPTMYASWVGSLPSLIVLQQTVEDTQRTRQYQESRSREAYRGSVGSVEAFLRGLGLRADITQLDDDSMARVVQLLAKTNQFNLTTRRHDESTIRRRTASGEWRVYTMRVTDRFGDFGLTGVAIVVPGEGTWQLESFLMSCRVIGKSVETALLARIAEDAREAGATALSAEFIDSGPQPGRGGLPPQSRLRRGAGRTMDTLTRDRKPAMAGLDRSGVGRERASREPTGDDKMTDQSQVAVRVRRGDGAGAGPAARRDRPGALHGDLERLDLTQPPHAHFAARKRVRRGLLQHRGEGAHLIHGHPGRPWTAARFGRLAPGGWGSTSPTRTRSSIWRRTRSSERLAAGSHRRSGPGVGPNPRFGWRWSRC